MSKYFSQKEMQCKCCGKAEMCSDFMEKLDALREEFGQPMIVNSGYRCGKHNEAVGGKPASYHVKGKAVDIKMSGQLAGKYRDKLIELSYKHGFTGRGIGANYIHLDTGYRVANSMWVYK